MKTKQYFAIFIVLILGMSFFYFTKSVNAKGCINPCTVKSYGCCGCDVGWDLISGGCHRIARTLYQAPPPPPTMSLTIDLPPDTYEYEVISYPAPYPGAYPSYSPYGPGYYEQLYAQVVKPEIEGMKDEGIDYSQTWWGARHQFFQNNNWPTGGPVSVLIPATGAAFWTYRFHIIPDGGGPDYYIPDYPDWITPKGQYNYFRRVDPITTIDPNSLWFWQIGHFTIPASQWELALSNTISLVPSDEFDRYCWISVLIDQTTGGSNWSYFDNVNQEMLIPGKDIYGVGFQGTYAGQVNCSTITLEGETVNGVYRKGIKDSMAYFLSSYQQAIDEYRAKLSEAMGYLLNFYNNQGASGYTKKNQILDLAGFPLVSQEYIDLTNWVISPGGGTPSGPGTPVPGIPGSTYLPKGGGPAQVQALAAAGDPPTLEQWARALVGKHLVGPFASLSEIEAKRTLIANEANPVINSLVDHLNDLRKQITDIIGEGYSGGGDWWTAEKRYHYITQGHTFPSPLSYFNIRPGDIPVTGDPKYYSDPTDSYVGGFTIDTPEPGVNSQSLTWDNVPSATSYRVSVSSSPGGFSFYPKYGLTSAIPDYIFGLFAGLTQDPDVMDYTREADGDVYLVRDEFVKNTTYLVKYINPAARYYTRIQALKNGAPFCEKFEEFTTFGADLVPVTSGGNVYYQTTFPNGVIGSSGALSGAGGIISVKMGKGDPTCGNAPGFRKIEIGKAEAVSAIGKIPAVEKIGKAETSATGKISAVRVVKREKEFRPRETNAPFQLAETTIKNIERLQKLGAKGTEYKIYEKGSQAPLATVQALLGVPLSIAALQVALSENFALCQKNGCEVQAAYFKIEKGEIKTGALSKRETFVLPELKPRPVFEKVPLEKLPLQLRIKETKKPALVNRQIQQRVKGVAFKVTNFIRGLLKL